MSSSKFTLHSAASIPLGTKNEGKMRMRKRYRINYFTFKDRNETREHENDFGLERVCFGKRDYQEFNLQQFKQFEFKTKRDANKIFYLLIPFLVSHNTTKSAFDFVEFYFRVHNEVQSAHAVKTRSPLTNQKARNNSSINRQ